MTQSVFVLYSTNEHNENEVCLYFIVFLTRLEHNAVSEDTCVGTHNVQMLPSTSRYLRNSDNEQRIKQFSGQKPRGKTLSKMYAGNYQT